MGSTPQKVKGGVAMKYVKPTYKKINEGENYPSPANTAVAIVVAIAVVAIAYA